MRASVLVPYRPDGTHRQVIAEFTFERLRRFFPDWEICVGDDEGEPFSRSRARNLAARQASGDVFVICDADTIANRETYVKAVERVTPGTWVLPYEVYYNLSEERTDHILASSPADPLPEPSPEMCEHIIRDAVSGIVVMARRDYEKVGGYDERFIGWGYEDNAFALSAKRRLGPAQRLEGFVAHLWHPAPEEVRFGQPHIHHNRRLFQRHQRQ